MLQAAFTVACLGLTLLPAQASAQQRRRPDFLFRTPRVALAFRAGYAMPIASSEIFDFTRQQLTVSRSDFASATWEGEVAIRATDRVDVALDLGYARSRTPSEFRDWVGTDDLPISQTTEFKRVPLTLGVKAYLEDRGRSVGRFAWIPRTFAPFVGAGAGWVWYTFDQQGEFVDFDTYDVFPDHFTTTGRAPTIHLFGGADWSLAPGFLLTTEARYAWARGEMGADFEGFDRLDLSGFQATAGISVRF
jgi:hypothetical protein